ncbi:MAG: S1 RNA-binding domain-containing protein, partial [Patescibacteria group bacterium]
KEVLPAARTELSQYAPMVSSMMINPDKIRDVIGKGGETIQKIQAECNVEIDIEQTGLVMITAANQEGGKKAMDWVKMLTYEPQAGEEFEGTVVKLMDFGAFVEFLPGRDGLVHISALRPYRVNRVEDVVKLGEKVRVKLQEVDSQGRYNLSMKEFYKDEKPQGGAAPQQNAGPRRDDGDPGHF